MPKASPERRYTSVRALYSAYCPKPIAVAVGVGKGALTGGPVKGAAKAPLPHLCNCNTPKILKNFNVYAKQTQIIAKASKTTVRRWVNPPYPVHRLKKKNQSSGPRNYDTFYVPLDNDSQCSDSSNASAETPYPGQRPNISKAVDAKRRKIYISRWTQLEPNQEVLKEEQPPFTKFPCLLPAGERHSLKVQINKIEMVKLIAEVKEIRQQLGLGYESPLPSPPQNGEFQPLPLMRSRTRTCFSICDCLHPKLYEYSRRLHHASISMTHVQTKQGGSGITPDS
ncbi:hypothetical protein KR038_009844 [Drosophila bunnanda]|nr:hypothetical protein KR038_009844 [Drosophila bunnanda]